MVRHRIFIAISLPADIVKRLAGIQKQWPELPASWTRAENLHITLAFLGAISNLQLGEVCQAVARAAKRHRAFEAVIGKVGYGGTGPVPRYVRADVERSKPLNALARDLIHHLEPLVSMDDKPFAPHIMLARIRSMEWRVIDPEERPDVSELLNLSFPVESIAVMESRLSKTGPSYEVIESFPLAKQ